MIARGQEMVRGVAAGAHATNPATMPPSQMYGGTGFGPPALPPAYTAPTTEPIPSSQPGRPVIPPEQRPPPAAPVQAPISASPYNPAGAPGGAGTQSGGAAVPPTPGTGLTVLPPGGGGEPVTGGVPQAQAQPPSTLGRVLSAFNPIGSAHAETMPPPAQQDTAAPSPATVAAQAQPAPVTTPAPPAQAQGVTTATPPKAAAAETKAGPVQTPAKVTSDQPGPSVQSQSEPAGIAPPISPSAWIDGSQNHKEVADLIPGLVESNGGYPGMTIQIAATIRRESNWNPKAVARNPDGSIASMGLMQITPATWRMFDPDNRLDPYKAEDNIKVGIEYYKYLAKEFGAGNVPAEPGLHAWRGWRNCCPACRLARLCADQ